MKPRFDELLPFYVNGSLAQEDREWVEAYLREHPKAEAELRWYQSLQTKLREDAPPVPADIGLERTMARIRAERPQSERRTAKPPTLFETLRGWLASITPQPVLRPAFAGALAVVAVQAIVIANLVVEKDESTELRAMRGSAIEQGPYLKVNFKADAREADIRLLLVEIHGSLAAGPGQLGDYYVRVPAAQLAAVEAKVKSSPIVEGLSVVDGLPGKE
jgi:hypothetical protein